MVEEETGSNRVALVLVMVEVEIGNNREVASPVEVVTCIHK
jgi:hypothetical protein